MEALLDYFREYALFVAVALPLLVVASANLGLWMSGERGTLALPSLQPFPSIKIAPARFAEMSAIDLRELRLDADDASDSPAPVPGSPDRCLLPDVAPVSAASPLPAYRTFQQGPPRSDPVSQHRVGLADATYFVALVAAART